MNFLDIEDTMQTGGYPSKSPAQARKELMQLLYRIQARLAVKYSWETLEKWRNRRQYRIMKNTKPN